MLFDLAAPKIGFCCQCHEGWYGADCSIPSIFLSTSEWPQWLHPAHVDLPGYAHAARSVDALGAATVVTKKRPLIYVYELPPEFNSLLLEVSEDHAFVSTPLFRCKLP